MEQINNRICPWWMGYMLLIPVRKWGQNPDKILKNHINPGMTILDFGCAMGYFSLPLAKMTGKEGTVYCVDIQEKMLEKLQKRADKAGVGEIIKLCHAGKTFNSSVLANQIDFAMLFAVVHEVPDKVQLFKDMFKMLKPGGKVLFAEPKGHVSADEFEISVTIACAAGFRVIEEKPMQKGLSAFLIK